MSFPWFARLPTAIVLMGHARPHGLQLQTHGLAGDRNEALYPQHRAGLGDCRYARCERAGFGDFRQSHDEAVEIVMIMFRLEIVTGAAVGDVFLGADAEA